MAGEFDSITCKVFSGTNASPVAILGQGTMGLERGETPIIVDNKDSEWQEVITGASTTRSRNITVEFDVNSDPGYVAMVAAVAARTVDPYVINRPDKYFEGNFMVTIASDTYNKSESGKQSIIFTSSGEITEGIPA
jgi:hypothetical protein